MEQEKNTLFRDKIPVFRIDTVMDRYMERMNYTFKDYSNKMGLTSRNFLYLVYRGEKGPTLDMVLEWMQALNINVDYILGFSDIEERPIADRNRMHAQFDIKRLLSYAGINQTQLCEITGISNSSFSRTTKKGEMSLRLLLALRMAFSVSADYLLGLTDEPVITKESTMTPPALLSQPGTVGYVKSGAYTGYYLVPQDGKAIICEDGKKLRISLVTSSVIEEIEVFSHSGT